MTLIRRFWPFPGRDNRPALALLVFSAVYSFALFGIPDVILNFYYVSVGYDSEAISALQSVPRIAGLLTGLPIGLLASRLGERRLLALSTLCAALALGAMVVLPPTPFQLILTRFLIGLFYGAGQIALPVLMVRLVSERRTTTYFAVFNIVGMGMNALGSLIGGYLPAWLAGIIGVAVGSSGAYGAALAVAALLLITSVLPLGSIPERAQAQRREPLRFMRGMPWRRIALLSLPMLFFGFTGGLTFPFYNLFFRETFALSDEAVGIALSIGWLSMALIPMLNPFWEQRFGRAGALGVLMTISAVAFFGLSLTSDARALVPSLIAFAIAIGVRNCNQPLFQPLQIGSLPREQHNAASSVSSVIWNLGWFSATAISGTLQTQFGYPTIMAIVAVGVLLCGISVVLVYRGKQEQPERIEPAADIQAVQEFT